MTRRPIGWRNESARHSLASRGIKSAQKIPKMRNQKVYKRPKYETFTLMNTVYDIRKAEEFIKPEDIKETEPTQKMLIPLIAFDEEHIKEVDLSKPVIFATDRIGKDKEKFLLLIDGNHRIRKALMEKKKIRYVILNEKQTEQIKKC